MPNVTHPSWTNDRVAKYKINKQPALKEGDLPEILSYLLSQHLYYLISWKVPTRKLVKVTSSRWVLKEGGARYYISGKATRGSFLLWFSKLRVLDGVEKFLLLSHPCLIRSRAMPNDPDGIERTAILCMMISANELSLNMTWDSCSLELFTSHCFSKNTIKENIPGWQLHEDKNQIENTLNDAPTLGFRTMSVFILLMCSSSVHQAFIWLDDTKSLDILCVKCSWHLAVSRLEIFLAKLMKLIRQSTNVAHSINYFQIYHYEYIETKSI